MMTRYALISIIVVLSAAYCAVGQPGPRCPDPNAFWNFCGSRCEFQCPVANQTRTCPPVSQICTAVCSCKFGYILGPDGICITYDECVRRIRCVGPTEVWNNCSRGCEPTCQPPSEAQVCPPGCIAKCTCARGYIRGPNGDCITMADCAILKRCGQNEVWNECGNNCEPLCFEPPNRPVCPPVCVRKCMCRPGFVRGPNGRCILRSQCPA